MRLLLDTHVAIWALRTPAKLGPEARRLIGDESLQVFVSIVSVWEIAIKRSQQRPGRPPFSGAEAVGLFTQAGYELLPIAPEHVTAVEHLPHHHGDPFDRLLVAQALTEPLRLVSADERVLGYGTGFVDARV